MPIQIYSFFSGVGFLDLGFQNAGFDIAFVDEYDERFLRAYQYARRADTHVPQYGYSHSDVQKFLSNDVWNATFPDYRQHKDTLIGFIGGPPCPDFSTAGKNEGGTGKNGQLTSVYVSLIIKRQPDFFVLENVKGLYHTKKHKDYYNRVKRRLYRAGYTLFDTIENALEYGTPQYRDRLFLVGFARERFGRRIQYKFGTKRIYTIEAIRNTNWPSTAQFVENGVLEMPAGIIENLTVEHWFRQNDVQNHPNGADIFKVKSKERFDTIPEGDSAGKSFKRLHRWRFSPTAAYGNNEVHLHPYLPRRLSVAEALSIQSLPATFEIPSNLPLSAKFKMVGNGVPYLLALGIATELYEWINAFLDKIGE